MGHTPAAASCKSHHTSPRSTKTRVPASDRGPEILTRLCHQALRQAAAAIPSCTTASCTQPELIREHHDRAPSDCAWRLAGLERDVSCLADAGSSKVLFGWIVGTTPLRALTKIELTIVDDVVRRLFAAATISPYADGMDGSLHANTSPMWVCRLRLQRADSPSCVNLSLVATADAPIALGQACRRSLLSVLLPLRAAIPGVPCTLGTIRSLRPGTLLALHRSPAELAVMLYAGRRYIAATQLGAAHGTRALKVLELTTGRP